MSKLNRISMQSRVQHAIGCVLYGTPKQHGLPDDFYYLIEDRQVRGMQTNVYANLTRAKLIRAERWMGKALALALGAVWLVVVGHTIF